MPGWPWLLWRTTCRLRLGAWLDNVFGHLHHFDVDGNDFHLVEVLLHDGHYVDSVNDVPTSTAFSEVCHHFEGRNLGVKRLRVFYLSIPCLVDICGEEAHYSHLSRLVEEIIIFAF